LGRKVRPGPISKIRQSSILQLANESGRGTFIVKSGSNLIQHRWAAIAIGTKALFGLKFCRKTVVTAIAGIDQFQQLKTGMAKDFGLRFQAVAAVQAQRRV
jgi:hypothetical protein